MMTVLCDVGACKALQELGVHVPPLRLNCTVSFSWLYSTDFLPTHL